ncbi:MAG TPA: ABC transporter permease [Terracidiphilus sp.]|nr:ABC transporter permease [Terracidiphilus sp.]
MRWLDQFCVRMNMLFHRGAAARRLDDEIQFHLERQVAENIAAGMSREEARYAALRTFGNPALLREQTRSSWNWNWLESIFRDLRIAARTLLRAPGFAVIAVLVMALGIGSNIALFTVVRSVLLEPLPFQDPNRLVTLYEADTHRKGHFTYLPVDFGSFSVWQQSTQDVAQMAAVSPWQDANVSAQAGKLPEKVRAAWCSWNLFPLLGVTPSLGRAFAAQDDRPDAPATAILMDTFWKRRYGGDPNVIGKTFWLDAKPYTVIGILPPAFKFSSSFGGNTLMIWLPVKHEAPGWLLTTFEDHEFIVIGRLSRSTTLAAIVGRLKALQKQIQATHPQPALHDSATGHSMLDDAVETYKTPLYALLAATGCLLLIACMNVASLLVARAATRSRELAIRSALGGGKLRLMRERLIESLLLSAVGGALGLSLAWAALLWLVHVRADMNRIDTIHIDSLVVVFSFAIITVCALFSGLVAAFSSSAKHLLAALRESSRSHSAGTARAGLRRSLLVLEVGLTVVLLVSAGLLLKSYQRLRSNDIGVPIENVLTMRVSLPDARYKQPEQKVAFFEQLITRVRAVPGVEGAGLVSTAPGEGFNGDQLMSVVEHPPLPARDIPDLHVRGADPGYFAAIHIPLLRGRIFTSEERLKRANVVVISQSAARVLFPHDEPIGKHLRTSVSDPAYEILGVVGDTRWDVAQPPAPTLYWPIYGNNYDFATIVVRSSHNVDALALPVQKIVSELDPDLPVSNVISLKDAIGLSTIDSAFDSILVLAFAIIALVLAAAGLYGVLAYLVAQRTNEIGIRIALGSPRRNVLRLMLADGLQPALIGLAIGLMASAATVRLIRSMLYETQPLDPAVFAAVTAAFLAVAAFACLFPAWRASRLDPVEALRNE